jgi:bifunctional ADP-heptose synthase (sugar kinase/adenylyltransferase)
MQDKLRSNVRMNALSQKGRPTVRKLRFLEPNYMTKMFEMQYLNDSPIDAALEREFTNKIEDEIRKHDLIVVNDFGHGLLTENLRRLLSSCGKYLALNTQSNSANHGYNTVTNYDRADFVSIDEPEMHLAAKNKFGEIDALSKKLREQLKARTFLVSRGALGAVVFTDSGVTRAPALATRIVDRTGAGDALFALTSPLAYRDAPPDVLAFIGNCVGALAVEIVCNREPIDSIALFKFIQTLLK